MIYCSGNKLTSLPTLPPTLEFLVCPYNELIFLPILPEKLKVFECYNNKLAYLPTLPNHMIEFNINNNPIVEIIYNGNFNILKKNIDIVNNFRHLYYCIKFRAQFRKCLWEKIREPKIAKKYDPNYLIKNLKNNADLDKVLDEW